MWDNLFGIYGFKDVCSKFIRSTGLDVTAIYFDSACPLISLTDANPSNLSVFTLLCGKIAVAYHPDQLPQAKIDEFEILANEYGFEVIAQEERNSTETSDLANELLHPTDFNFNHN